MPGVGVESGVRTPLHMGRPAPSIRGVLCEQEGILHASAATKTCTPQSSSSAQLDSSLSLILKGAHSLVPQAGKHTGTSLAASHTRPVVSKLPQNVKQMSLLKEKLFLLWKLSEQAET